MVITSAGSANLLPGATTPKTELSNGSITFTEPRKIYVSFIKTQQGAFSGTIDGGSLPKVTATMYVQSTAGYGDAEIELGTWTFSGDVPIVNATCDTSKVDVVLGDHHKSEFTGRGSTTEWVPFDITLQNCTHVLWDGRWAGSSSVDMGSYSRASAVSNYVTVTFEPVTPVLTSSEGIIALTTSDDSAEGIGIQMASGNINSYSLINLSSGFSVTPEPGSVASGTKIPLLARYIQMEDVVKSGQANGTILFSVDYY